jgi:hypothetical protein
MVKAEMAASVTFDKNNPGHNVGQDFEQVCSEILYSDTVASFVLSQVRAIDGLGLEGVMKSMTKIAKTGDATGKIGKLIKENKELFFSTLAMFYWGMEIGRKLERELQENMQKVDQAYTEATKTSAS